MSTTSAPTSTRATIVVSFPPFNATTGAPIKFDKDYYFNVHIPKVAETWVKHGYIGYQFFEFPNPNPFTGEPPEYAYQTIGYFETMEGMGGAALATREAAMSDIVSFVDLGEGVGPVVAVGVQSHEK